MVIRWLNAGRLPNGARYRWRFRDKPMEQLVAECPPRSICTCGRLPLGSPRLCDQCRAYRNVDRIFGGLVVFIVTTVVYLRFWHPGQMTADFHRWSDYLSVLF
jgi:hypothetical protein